MFDRCLTVERAFDHTGGMARTRVRWGRVVALGAAASIGIAGLAAGRAGAGPAPHPYVVRPGDTVWDIARSLVGGGDPRPVVDRIVRDNHLHDATIVPGERLRLPSGR